MIGSWKFQSKTPLVQENLASMCDLPFQSRQQYFVPRPLATIIIFGMLSCDLYREFTITAIYDYGMHIKFRPLANHYFLLQYQLINKAF